MKSCDTIVFQHRNRVVPNQHTVSHDQITGMNPDTLLVSHHQQGMIRAASDGSSRKRRDLEDTLRSNAEIRMDLRGGRM